MFTVLFKLFYMEKTKENTDKLLQFIAEKYQGGDLNNESLVKVIELCGSYLNLQTLNDHNSGDLVMLFGTQFLIDNE